MSIEWLIGTVGGSVFAYLVFYVALPKFLAKIKN